MEELEILLFYKFVPIKDPETFQKEHLQFCSELGVKGKVLVGTEGINGSISGTSEQTEQYMRYLRSDDRFKDIIFKIEKNFFHPFKKMIVRVKDEIIRIDTPLDMSKTGTYIEPEVFLKIADDPNVVILDTRNDYEWMVGKFKNALTLPIKTFREFPQAVKQLEHLKNKKIVMYCTGGIRCEKASAYMIQQGFNDVSQLHGGIITFAQEKPKTVWQGSCFVFDNRLISNIDGSDPISFCVHCKKGCDSIKNCRNKSCDAYAVLCSPCEERYKGCCSESCLNSAPSREYN